MKKEVVVLSLILLALVSLSVHAQDAFEPDDIPANATFIFINGTGQNHSFGSASDVDYVKFNATAGYVYIINTSNLTDINTADTVISLYASDGTTLLADNDDISTGIIRTSELWFKATSNGTYYVKIIEFSGNTGNYSIRVEQQGQLEPYVLEPLDALNITKGDVFNVSTGVRCTGGPCVGISAILDPDEETDKKVDELLQGNESAHVIITFASPSLPSSYSYASKSKKAVLIAQQKKAVDETRSEIVHEIGLYDSEQFSTIPAIAATVDQQDIDRLLLRDDVISIEPDREVHTFLDSSVPLIRAHLVQNMSIGGISVNGTGETVCVIDTGITYTHPDFGSCGLTNNINDGSCPAVIGGVDLVNGDNNPLDDNGHGTHVAGIVASRDGVYRGVAPGAKLVAVKALNAGGGGSLLTVIQGIDWCVANASKFNISVITLSLGTSDYHSISDCDQESSAAASAINAARAAGILVTIASGNDGAGQAGLAQGLSNPSCIRNATSVGATDDSSILTGYSNRGPYLDLVAPGNGIISSDQDLAPSAHMSLSGTSMATPHVAGVAALLNQYYKLNYGRSPLPQDVDFLMKYSGVVVLDSATGLSFSRVDAYAATQLKGMVSTTVNAEPFYTTSSNPISCGTLLDGQTCNSTWTVKATKEGSYSFFTIYEGAYSSQNSSRFQVMVNHIPLNVTVSKTANVSNTSINDTVQFVINITNNEQENVSVVVRELYSSSSLNLTGFSEPFIDNLTQFNIGNNSNKIIVINATILSDGSINNTISVEFNTSNRTLLKNASVELVSRDITPPQVHAVNVSGSLLQNTPVVFLANVTDNVALDVVQGTIGSTLLIFNSSQQATFTPAQAGVHTLLIFANDTSGNINSAYQINFTVLADVDGDLIADSNDTLLGSGSSIDSSGTGSLTVLVGGNSSSGSFSGLQTVDIKKGSASFINFTHNFSESTLNLSNVKIIEASTEVVINLGFTAIKSVYVDDHSYDELCVKDTTVSSTGTMTTNCTGSNEYTLSSCIGNATGVIVAHVGCKDIGSRLLLTNLSHSAIRGKDTTISASSSGGSGGGGGASAASSTSLPVAVTITPNQEHQTIIVDSGSLLTIIIDSKSYGARVREITQGLVTISPVGGSSFGLVQGVEFNLDVTLDGKKDMTVTLVSLVHNKITLSYVLYEPVQRVYVAPVQVPEKIKPLDVESASAVQKEVQEPEVLSSGIIAAPPRTLLDYLSGVNLIVVLIVGIVSFLVYQEGYLDPVLSRIHYHKEKPIDLSKKALPKAPTPVAVRKKEVDTGIKATSEKKSVEKKATIERTVVEKKENQRRETPSIYQEIEDALSKL